MNKSIEQIYLNTNNNIISVCYGYKIKNNIKTDIKSIVYYVLKKKSKEELSQDEIIPKNINIEGTLYETDVQQYSKFIATGSCNNSLDPSSQQHRQILRPLKGGISFGAFEPMSLSDLPSGAHAGTLGGIAIDKEDGSIVYITNNHVCISDGFINSDKNANILFNYNLKNSKIIQPGSLDTNNSTTDANYIGLNKRYYPLKLNEVNYIDAAVIHTDFRFLNKNESFKILGLENTYPLPFATTDEINSLIDNNITLYKSGRSTGLNSNNNCRLIATGLFTAASVGGYRLQSFESINNQVIDFSNVITFAYSDSSINSSAPGDSGSLLIGNFNNIFKIVGIVFAGNEDGTSSLACRIDVVSELLNIDAWRGDSWQFSDFKQWDYIIKPGLTSNITINENNKKYWQVGVEVSSLNDETSSNSVYVNFDADQNLTSCFEYDKCSGQPLGYNSILTCTEQSPQQCEPPIEPPPPPDPPEDPIIQPKVNFNNQADWNDQDGNVTTVGSNGPRSPYSTFDQNGNVWEITDQTVSGEKICRGGAYNSILDDLTKCNSISVSSDYKSSNIGFRLSRTVQNIEDSDDNILYVLGTEGDQSTPVPKQTISAFKVEFDGSINEIKRIYSDSTYTQSGSTPIGRRGLTNSYSQQFRLPPKTITDRVDYVVNYKAGSLVVINDLIYILYEKSTVYSNLQIGSNSSTENKWWTDVSVTIEAIKYSTGEFVGSFSIDLPKPKDFSSFFSLRNDMAINIGSLDSDGYYLYIEVGTGDGGVNSINQNTYVSCYITIDPADGSIISKEFIKFESNSGSVPRPAQEKKIINNYFIRTRYANSYLSNDPVPNGGFREWVQDTFLIDKNNNLLSNKFFDLWKWYYDQGWIELLTQSNGILTWNWSLPTSLTNLDDTVDSFRSQIVFKTNKWAFDGTKLYGMYYIRKYLYPDGNPDPDDPRVRTFGFIVGDIHNVELERNPVFPVWLKNQDDYQTSFNAVSISENYAKNTVVRPFVFSTWSRIGDANNSSDNCGGQDIGSVDEAFYIQRYQMTNAEYCVFLNDVAKSSDPYGLWDSNMQDGPRGGILRQINSGNYTYQTKTNMSNKPVNFINWFCAARFANWLHNKTNDINSKNTESGAYLLNGAISGNIAANDDALFRIPSADQWYKAAYYKGGSTNAGYWTYAVSSDIQPEPVCATINGSGKVCND